MPFFLTLAYIVITVLSPNLLIPELVPYRPMQVLAGVLALISLPKLLEHPACVRTRQFWLAVAFMVIVLLSNAVHLWFGGVVFAAENFLPDAIVMFLLMLHADTLPRLRILAFVVWALAAIIAAEGLAAYFTGYGGDLFLYTQNLFVGNTYVGHIYRIRGPGIMQDPNDTAQFLEVALALPWLLWRRRRALRNLFLVYAPTAYFGVAIYFTRSRGALLGLAAMLLFALRRRLGNLAAGILTGLGVAAAFALNFTGGRDIANNAGGARQDLWSSGLQLLRGNPVFGVGFGQFTETNVQTAHNCLVLTLAELGSVGAWVWVALVTTTFAATAYYLSPARRSAQEPVPEPATAAAGSSPFPFRTPKPAAFAPSPPAGLAAGQANLDTALLARWAGVLTLSQLAFLVTGFFLSRAYATIFFLTFGMAGGFIMFQMSQYPTSNASWRWVKATTLIEVAGIALVYLLARGH